MERDIVGKLKQITGLADHNIPKIEKLVHENTLTVSLTLIQPINDLLYFETFDKYAIPLANLEKHFKRRSLEECATLGKRNANWLGFQQCADSACYSVLDANQFELDNVNNTDYEKQCITMRKAANRKSYVELPVAVELIERSVEQGDFKLKTTGLTFQRLENENEFNQIDKMDYFRRVQDERCFDTEKLKDVLQCKSKPKIADCILTCQSSNCSVFSVHRLTAYQVECCFAEPTFYELKQKYGEFSQPNEACSIYELSYLNKFNVWPSKTLKARPKHLVLKASPEDCAIECLKTNKEFQCLSFSLCYSEGDYHCELRSYNVHNQTSEKLINSNHCTFYSGESNLCRFVFSNG